MDIVRPGLEAVGGFRGRETRWSSGKARLDSGALMEIAHKPKFQIPVEAPIFTMGSCFTRVIENTLLLQGWNIVLKPHGLPHEYYENWDPVAASAANLKPGQLGRTCFNKYTVHSMSHELRRVLHDETYDNEGLIELAENQWFDPHASSLRLFDLETARSNRQEIRDGTAKIRHADFVIFTLGLTEGWTDTKTGLAMNNPPSGRNLSLNAGRFRFIDYGYDSILAEFLDLIALIRRTCNPDMKFIVTVSPIPMITTFRNLDIMVAHSASKAVLRAVADEAQRRLEYVDYFPAYEIVVHSPRHLVWLEDQMHVAPEVTKTIARQFIEKYRVQQAP